MSKLWRSVTYVFLIPLLGGCGGGPRYYSQMTLLRHLAPFNAGDVPKYYGPTGWSDERFSTEITTAIVPVNILFKERQLTYLFLDNSQSKNAQIRKDEDKNCVDLPPGKSPTDDDFVQLSLQRRDGHIQHCVRAHIEIFSQPLQESSNSDKQTESQPVAEIEISQGSGIKPPTAQDAAAKSTDELLQKFQLVISSYLYTTEPADRLFKSYVLVSPLSPGVSFVETPGERTTQLVQVGTATTGEQVGLSAGTPAGFPAALTLSPQLSRTIAEQVARQYTTTNVEIFPLHNILLISEEAGPGAASIDGNAVTDITLRLPTTLCNYMDVFAENPSNPSQQRPSSGSPDPSNPPKTQLTPSVLQSKNSCYIDRVLALTASIAVVRAVKNDYRAIQEDSHNVAVIPFKTAAVVELWTNPKRIYGLVQRQYPKGSDEQVLISTPSGDAPALFDDEANALAFRYWLVSQSKNDTAMLNLRSGTLKWERIEPFVKLNSPLRSEALELCVVGTPWPSTDRLLENNIQNAIHREYCPLPAPLP